MVLEVLKGSTLNLQVLFFNSIAIFMIWILPIHGHGRSFHLCMSSAIYFSRFYRFHCRGFSPPWLSLCIVILFFEAILNGTVFLTSFSAYSLLVYWKATDFCVLIYIQPHCLLWYFVIIKFQFLRKLMKEKYLSWYFSECFVLLISWNSANRENPKCFLVRKKKFVQ
jgi:hypothetical protein